LCQVGQVHQREERGARPWRRSRAPRRPGQPRGLPARTRQPVRAVPALRPVPPGADGL